jgi:hypothetical protein
VKFGPSPALWRVFDIEEKVTVVAPDNVYDAANRLVGAMAAFKSIAAQDPSRDRSPWDRGDASAMWDAHDAFITAARADLGVGHRPISNA